MKKIILIFSVILTVFGLFISGLPSILQWTGMDEPLKQFIIPRLIDTTRSAIDINQFRIGLNRIELSDVSVELIEKRTQLSIKSIQFKLNLPGLLFRPLSPQNAVDAVYLQQPTLTIAAPALFPDSSANQMPALEETMTASKINTLLKNINRITAINEVIIRDGCIQWQLPDGAIAPMVQKLNGKLFMFDSTQISLKAEGSLITSDKANFNIDTDLDFQNLVWNCQLNFNEIGFGKSFFNPFPDQLSLSNGILSGHLFIKNKSLIPDSTITHGIIKVSQFSGEIFGHVFSDTRLQAEITDNHCHLTDFSGKYFENRFVLTGDFDNILKPVLRGAYQLPDVHPGSIINSFSLLQRIALAAHGDVEYDFMNGQLKARLCSDSIAIDGRTALRGIVADFCMQKDQLFCNHFSGNFGKARFSGEAAYDASGQKLTVSLKSAMPSANGILLDRLFDKTQEAGVDFSWYAADKTLRGNWRYSIAAPDDTLLTIRGILSGEQDRLSLKLTHSDHPGVMVQAMIENLYQKPSLVQARLVNLPLSDFTTNALFINLLKNRSTEISLSGNLDQLQGRFDVTDPRSLRQIVYLNTLIDGIGRDKIHINGNLDVFFYSARFNIDIDKNGLQGKLVSAEGLDGDIGVSFGETHAVTGLLRLHDFNVIRAFSDSLSRDDFRFMGNLDGFIELSGSLSDPKVNGRLSGDKFVFHDIGYYQAEADFQADTSQVLLDTIQISLNNWPVLNGHGQVNLTERTVKASCWGTDLDAEQIFNTLLPQQKILNGTASYTINLAGNLDAPELSADLRLINGRFDRIAFDSVAVQLHDRLSPGGNFTTLQSHFLQIDNFSVQRKDAFYLNGRGELPLSSGEPIDLDFSFKGDAFGFIPLWVPFFEHGSCNADIRVTLGGTNDRIRIVDGYARIEDGVLRLQQVAPYISNINGIIEKPRDSNQVNFIDFNATVNKQVLTINTVRNIKPAGYSELKNWYFKGTDLDFGILQLETSAGGVEVNIPGLMTGEDVTRLYLSGKNENERFYFAGPVKHPVAYGMATMYNSRVTYPFLGGGTASKKVSPALQFLMDMDWQVLVKSGEDVQYFREIPAYIDNVNMEVYVDESSPGLEFHGIIQAGTFKPEGKLTCSRGRLEYLDQNFKVDYFSMEFTDADQYPVIAGRAWTTIRDSVGAIPKTIYLQLYARDEESGEEKQQGNWENFRFKLVSADPKIGESQEQVLAYLGFSVENIREKATSVGSAMTERYVFRPLFRPIERALERNLGVDLVRFNSNIARNLFYGSVGFSNPDRMGKKMLNPYHSNAPYLFLVQSSEVTLGKYLTQDLYLTYTGQLVSLNDQSQTMIDFNHSFGVEYRFLRNVLLEFEYDRELMNYYNMANQKQYLEDFKIRLRHSFSF
jgi:hypothetical protein